MFLNIFGKKRLKEKTLAANFVDACLESIDEGFKHVAGLINESPEFVSSPNVSEKDHSKFTLIVIAGNLLELPKHFEAYTDDRLMDAIYSAFAEVFGRDKLEFKEKIAGYQSYMKRVNHPSKNTLYAMSKAMFFQYDLSKFQEQYFREHNCPNPMFLKRLDEAMEIFIYDWKSVSENYNLVR